MFTRSLVKSGALILFGSVILTLIVLVAGYLAYPDGYLDPFSHYTDLLPRTVTTQWNLPDCNIAPFNPDDTACRVYLESPFFSTVIMTIDEQNKISELVFEADNLRVADVAFHWGRPHMIRDESHITILRWDRGVTAIILGNSWNLYWKPVEYVRLEMWTSAKKSA